MWSQYFGPEGPHSCDELGYISVDGHQFIQLSNDENH